MTKLICSQCQDELFTASPQIFSGDVHVGCGGVYRIAEGIGEEGEDFRSKVNLQYHLAHFFGGGK